ncbi:MAG: hypothetical protein QOI36_1840 [Pseudonocardiales bacterium]|nr:hypothetical protein [Pseudonocardia sp.]MDT7650434.1 hypothetical protein [Pseudonocardiales bacterium]
MTEPSRAELESRGSSAPRAGHWFRSLWSDERELAHAIHGTVVGSAVMVAASLHGTLGPVVVTVIVTLLVYWATERYADLLAAGVHGRATNHRVAAVLRGGWPMLQSSYAPVVVLLVTSALGAELRAAVLAALVLSTVLLAGLGYAAARRSESSVLGALGWAAVSALLGVAVIALKLALH